MTKEPFMQGYNAAERAARWRRQDEERATEAVDMLERLRPGGPWLLTAIEPLNGDIKTITARTADRVRKFISDHNGERNLYFSVNPTRLAMDKKAKKTDLAAIEYIHGDLDPRDDESPEDAKARFLPTIEA